MFWHDIKETQRSVEAIRETVCVMVGMLTNHIADIQELVEYYPIEKMDNYMQNVDKLNSMVNELKGCVAMCRASLKEPHDFSFKLGYVCENIDKIADFVHKCEKKPPKTNKTDKKTDKKATKKNPNPSKATGV